MNYWLVFSFALVAATSFSSAARIVLVAGGGRDTNTITAIAPTAARLRSPFGVDFDPAGNLLLVEMTGHRVRKLDQTGKLSIIAGTGAKGFQGDGGSALSAEFNGIHNLAVTASGDIYLADTWNNRVRRIEASSGKVSTVSGTGEKGFGGDGGPATEAKFGGIYCVSFDAPGQRLLLADLDNLRIREVSLKTGVVRTVAGNGRKGIPSDGSRATEGPLVDPRAVVADRQGQIYVLERGGHALRLIDTNGIIQTVAGTEEKGYAGNGGPARSVALNGPKHLCLDRDDTVLIADTENHVILRYSPVSKTITRIAGTGRKGSKGVGGSPLNAELNQPHGVSVSVEGMIFISDSSNHRVLKLVP